MNKKDEALQHLSEIKSVLVDKDSFFPYNYNALIIWGVIGMIMTVFMGYLLQESVLYGTIFSTLMIGLGFLIEGFLTKRVNKNYDIEDCTHRQRFIMTLFTALSLFGIVLSAIFAKYNLIIPIYIIWLFLIGVGDFAVGFVLNIKLFKFTSTLKMSVSIALMIICFFISDLGNLNSLFHYFIQGMTFALLGIMPILVGRKLSKEL
jgi:O-antigen/teichoic acid export membrane protein